MSDTYTPKQIERIGTEMLKLERAINKGCFGGTLRVELSVEAHPPDEIHFVVEVEGHMEHIETLLGELSENWERILRKMKR